jgi:hypothetical protein
MIDADPDPEPNPTVHDNPKPKPESKPDPVIHADPKPDPKPTPQPDTTDGKPVVVLSGNADVTLKVGATFDDPGATGHDAHKKALTVHRNGTVDTSKPGVYKITYWVKDAQGRRAEVVRTVRIVPSEPTPSPTPQPDTNHTGRTYLKLDNNLFINNTHNVAIMIVPDLNKSAKLIYDTQTIQSITKKLYDHVADAYDFIFLVTNNKERPSTVTYSGVFSKVKNDVKGIGAPEYDHTDRYGSSGALKGIMHFAYRRAILQGPTLHEISHYWANKFRFDFNQAPYYRLGNGSHWGETSFFGGKGQLGGSDANTFKKHSLTYDGKRNRTWTLHSAASYGWNANGGNSIPYNDVELYLMGMIPKSDVKDLMIPKPYGLALPPSVKEDPTFVNDIYQKGRRYFMAVEMVRKRWSEVLSEHNIPDRDPDTAHAQKHFRILTVLLDTQMPAPHEVDIVGAQINNLSFVGNDHNDRNYNFWEATRGQGSLQANKLDDSIVGSSDAYTIDDTFTAETVSFRGKTYRTVHSPYTGRVWLDRNLGADRVCTAFDDAACYGYLFAFGRGYDGHQKRTSPITQERKTSVSGNDNTFFVAGNSRPYDWVVKGVDGAMTERLGFMNATDGEGICPAGFRVPTIDEMRTETYGNEMSDPFPGAQVGKHFLKLPLAGYRNSQSPDGSVGEAGTRGAYWTGTRNASSSADNASIYHIFYTRDGFIPYSTRYVFNGESIRCIQAEN